MTAPEAFRNNLKRLIDEGEISPTALHEATGISRSSIRGWVEGENAPSLEQVQRVATALGRTAAELLAGELKSPLEALRLEAIGQLVTADERTVRSVLSTLKGAKAAVAPARKNPKPGAGSAGA